MTDQTQAYTYVAHKDGMFVGAISGTIGSPAMDKKHRWRREIEKFCGEAIAEGCDIKRCMNREEYEAFIKDMPVWKSQPRPPAQADLFEGKPPSA
jgi:hypothetical protein